MPDDFEEFLEGGGAKKDNIDPDVAGANPSTIDFGSINLDEVDESQPDFPVIAPGWYPAIIINVEAKTSSNGNPMMVWNFEMRDAENKGRQQFYNTVLNKPSGLKRIKKLILAILPDQSLADFNPKDFVDSGVALGKPAMIRLKVGSYQGKPNNSVTDVKSYEDDPEEL